MRKRKLKNLSLKLLFFIAFILSCTVMSADAVVGAFALEPKNISEQINVTITNAIFNFIKEQKNYKIEDLRPKTIDQNMENFDYVFTGAITGNDSGIELKLVLKNTTDNVTRSISKVYQNANLILLDSRILVSNLFDMSVNLSAYEKLKEENANNSETSFKEVTSIDSLSGSWQGEEGIERIEVMRGGRAIAVLNGGTSIFLHLTISDGYLVVKQSGKPNMRQFGSIPDEIAKKIIEFNKTPSWKFLISENNKVLSGEKTDLKVVYSGDEITSTKDIIKNVKWVRK